MPDVLLDTDILSEIFKQRSATVLGHAKRYLQRRGMLTFTSVSMVEILSGLHARDAKNQIARAEAFLGHHEQIVPQPEDYKLAARIIGMLKRQGRPIGTEDPLIAACAINRGMAVGSGNLRHYQFIMDAGFPLDLENWREE